MSEKDALPVVAHLVEGGRVFRDQAIIFESNAAECVGTRRDGSKASPLVRLSDASGLQKQLDECRADAERYRWLRAQHWHDGRMCVVVLPKLNVRPGSFCPSGELLDKEIDAALSSEKQHG